MGYELQAVSKVVLLVWRAVVDCIVYVFVEAMTHDRCLDISVWLLELSQVSVCACWCHTIKYESVRQGNDIDFGRVDTFGVVETVSGGYLCFGSPVTLDWSQSKGHNE